MEWSEDVKKAFGTIVVLHEKLDKLKDKFPGPDRPEEVALIIKALEFRLKKVKEQIAHLD